MARNTPYSATDMKIRNTACSGESVGPGVDGEARQHQAEHRERQDDGEEGVRALQVVGLLVVAQSADQQRQADHAVQHDHHHGEHRVAGERGHVGPVNMTAAIIIISMPLIASVSTSVP